MFRYPWELEKSPPDALVTEPLPDTPEQDFKIMLVSVDGTEPAGSWEKWMLFKNIYTVRARCGREAIGILSKRIGRGIFEAEFVNF